MNRHSPFAFWGLLVIPLLFCVVHAQDNDSSNSNDPMDRMFSQAHNQERQKIVDKMAEIQQNSPAPFPSAMGANSGIGKNQQSQGDQSAKMAENLPPSNVPLPSASPTNTGVPAPPPNIYIPPPSPGAAAKSTPSQQQQQQQPAQPPQSSINIYG